MGSRIKNGQELPTGWKWVKLGELPIDIGDGNYSSKYPRQSDFLNQGIPFIRASNLKDGTIDSTDMRYISSEQHGQLLKGHLKRGDVIVVTRGQLGEVAIVPSEHEDSNINAQLVRLRPDSTVLDNTFLFVSMQTASTAQQVSTLVTGATLKQLPIKNLKRLSFPLPPIKEQQAIAERLNEATEIKKTNAESDKKIEELKSSLLQRACRGEL